tara:strand:- start:200 stop:424 length:225 start_codon:yes stop_codon:yes gene_type:complete
MEFIKVKDNEHLIKNTKSNFIVNTNKSEYDEYIARRKLKQSEKQKVENIERDISTLRNEITEIKDLLRSLVNGN